MKNCECGHESFNHTRVGFPIDYPFPRCLVWVGFLRRCRCLCYTPQKEKS